MPTIDEYSSSAIQIQMQFEDTILGSATAFVFKQGEKSYLVTNWHVVTGKNPLTNQHLLSSAAEPDRLVAYLPIEKKLGKWDHFQVMLKNEDGEPIWFEHPKHQRQIDVVALPIDYPPGLMAYPINEMSSKPDMDINVGQDVFILGFPFGISAAGGFPVWKRGSIASEPEISIEGLPKIMVDTATRSGMSGSPVICRQWGSYLTKDGGVVMTTGSATKFLGIYSGRIGADDELKAQLGNIWKASVLPQLIEGQTLGSK